MVPVPDVDAICIEQQRPRDRVADARTSFNDLAADTHLPVGERHGSCTVEVDPATAAEIPDIILFLGSGGTHGKQNHHDEYEVVDAHTLPDLVLTIPDKA